MPEGKSQPLQAVDETDEINTASLHQSTFNIFKSKSEKEKNISAYIIKYLKVVVGLIFHLDAFYRQIFLFPQQYGKHLRGNWKLNMTDV